MRRNILEYLEEAALRWQGRVAVASGEGEMTFGALREAARNVGSFLLSRGHGRQSVAVLMERTPRALASFLGVVYAGGCFAALDAGMPEDRLRGILDILNPGAILCEENSRMTAEGLARCCPVYTYGPASSAPGDAAALEQAMGRILDTDPMYVVFTSGSTGKPKGVVGCHRAVMDYIENLCAVLPFDADTVFGSQSPLYFDAWFKEFFPVLKYGARMELLPRELFCAPVRLVEYLNERQINTLCWVAPALTLVSYPGTFARVRPEHLRCVAFASEALPPKQLKLWREAAPGARFFNLYGPTEATGICCYYEVIRDFLEGETIPIGGPFPNTEVFLLDERDRPAAPGEPGEICIRGSRLTLGYCGQEQGDFGLNPLQSLYPERIYRTGDMGRYNDRGELLFLGRKDGQIKHMGRRIELGEIETAAMAQGKVSSACCVYDPVKGRLTLYYTGEAEEGTLGEYLRKKLPRYMLPRQLRKLETMPRTENGKIARRLLEEA